LLSTSLNIPTWGNQKKTQDPLQAPKNSQPLTATTVSQTFFYALFIAHSPYTFVFRTSYWQCSFAADTLLRKLSHERYCTAYCEKQISYKLSPKPCVFIYKCKEILVSNMKLSCNVRTADVLY
jgi:hypothetical protein